MRRFLALYFQILKLRRGHELATNLWPHGYFVVLIYLMILLAGAWIVLPFAIKKMQINALRRRCRSERLIALTYDDGPSARNTGPLLDLLRENGASATFFVLGQKVDAFKEHTARIVGEGHEIGSHSYRHLHAWKCNPLSVFRDVQLGMQVVRRVAPCRLFRAPYGKITLGSLLQVATSGCSQSWWTIDSSDTWRTPLPLDHILGQVRKQEGGVLLMHDMDCDERPERADFVLELTRGLLLMARKEGFRICTLGDILKR